MPACSSVGSKSTSSCVRALAMTKSGFAARSVSTLGSVVLPMLATSSFRPRSNCVHVSSAEATMVSAPPAAHQTSAKLPMSVATRCGFSTVTVRSSASVNVTADDSAADALSKALAGTLSVPALPDAAAQPDSATAARTIRARIFRFIVVSFPGKARSAPFSVAFHYTVSGAVPQPETESADRFPGRSARKKAMWLSARLRTA